MPRTAVAAQARFVGRARELAVLNAALASARAGNGSLVLVSGEAGIGKSRLVHEFAAAVDVPVVRAACADDIGAPAFWPWTQLLRPLVSALAPDRLNGLGTGADDVRRLVEDVGSAQVDAVSRFRLFDSVAQVLDMATEATAYVAVIEDAHWADAPTLLLLHHLSALLPGMPLLVVATYRPDEAPDELTALLRSSTSIDLHGLRGDEVAALLTREQGPAPTEQTVATLESRTGGNPYFLLELARLLDAESRGAEGRLPTTVTAVVERRLARLPAPTVDLLGVAAVIGPDVSLALLTDVADLPASDVLDRLDPAAHAGLVTLPSPGLVSFAHALVREVLYAGLASVRRVNLHRRVGLALESRDGDPAALAHHWALAATDESDARRAIDHARQAAGRALSMLGYEEAAALYMRSFDLLGLIPTDAQLHGELLLGRGDALLRLGDLPAARDAYDEAAGIARRLDDVELLVAAALGFSSGLGGFEVRLGDRHQSELLHEALTALDVDAPARPLLLARLSVALSLIGSEQRQRELAEEAVASAREAADPVTLAQALAAHCDSIAGPAYSEWRLKESSEIVELATATGAREQELLGRRLRFVALLELGDPAAWQEAAAFGRLAETVRQPIYSWYVPLWQASRALAAGEIAEAERHHADAVRLGRLAHSENATMLTEVQRMMLDRAQGRIAEVIEQIATLFVPLAELAQVLPEFAMCYAEAGMIDDARTILERAEAVGYWQWDDAERLPGLVSAAQAVVILEDRHHAEHLLPLLLPWVERHAFEGIGAGCYGAVSRYVGRLYLLLDRVDEAIPFLEDAVERNQRAGLPRLADAAKADLESARSRVARPRVSGAATSGHIEHSGDVWSLTWSGATTQLRDAKGLRDLSILLARPGQAVHVLELVAASEGTTASAVPANGVAEPVLDRSALAAYRQRLRDIDDELDAATLDNDEARIAVLTEEREFLTTELSSALGLGGRLRSTSGPVERARKAVTARLRDTIRRVGKGHPALGRHLEHAVSTGTFCVYEPEQPTTWTVRT